MGAVLEQEFDDGRHPILFISKKPSGAECNYAVVEKEWTRLPTISCLYVNHITSNV
jgi:hypothetical protein